MHALSQTDCLALWESGQGLHPIDQGLLAVQAAFPETRSESVADWPLGRRNRALAELRCACFGTALHGWTSCGQCGEKIEFEVDGRAIAETEAAADDAAGHGQAVRAKGAEVVAVGDWFFRLPASRDLARIAEERDPAAAAARLLAACLIPQEGTAQPVGWSDEELETISERLALADPLAETLLHFLCPVCGESFEEQLDLAAFFWSELESRAKRLLFEVHTLASAYGWREAEILGLSPARREFYLEQVNA